MDLQDQELNRLRITQPAIRQTVPAAMAEATREDLPPSTESQSRGITNEERGSEVPPPAQERGSLQLGTGQPSTPFQHGIRASDASEGQHHLFRHDAYKGVFKLEAAKDYHPWSFTMMKFLEGEGLDKLVLGEFPKPGPPAVDATDREIRTYLHWNDANKVAERAIMSCIGKSQIGLLTRCANASEMWSRLQQTYAQDDETNILRLQGELQNVSWKKSMTVDAFIKDINDLSDQLRCCGDEPTDRALRLVLLKGIPSQHVHIKHILLQQENVTYNRLCDKLRSHVGLDTLSDSNNSGSAHISTTNERAAKKRDWKKKCSHCDKLGHEVKDCYKKDPSKAPKKGCFNCGKHGHRASECKSAKTDNKAEKDSGEEKQATTAMAVPMANVCLTEVIPEANQAIKSDDWIVDSGATHHMCNQQSLFTSEQSVKGSKQILLGDSSKIGVESEGKVELDLIHKKGATACILQDVLHVPEMARNLFSVTTSLRQGNDVSFKAEKMECIISRRGKTIGRASLRRGLWILDCKVPEPLKHSYLARGHDDLERWHKRFGHLGEESLKKLKQHDMVQGYSPRVEKLQDCKHCKAGKMSRLLFPKREEKADRDILSLVHSDLMGPITPATIGQKRYVLTFIDDRSRRAWIYLLKTKDETFSHFISWKAEAENQTGKKLKILRSDNGGEYLAKQFKQFREMHGILHETSTPHTPQQNGVAERYNRTLMDTVRSMMHGAGLKKHFWGEAIQTANYLRNISPTKGLKENVTPYDAYGGKKPTVDNLRVWGCKCAVHIPDAQRSKLDPKSWEGTLVGYSESQKGWRIWNPVKRQVNISRDVAFFETEVGNPPETDRENPDEYQTWEQELQAEESHREQGARHEETRELTVVIPPLPQFRVKENSQQRSRELPARESPDAQTLLVKDKSKSQESGSDNDEYVEETVVSQPPLSPSPEDEAESQTEEKQVEDPVQETVSEPRRSIRQRRAPERLSYSKLGGPKREALSAHAFISEAAQQLTYSDVLKADDRALWKAAIDREMTSLRENHTWKLVVPPPKTNIVGSKWLFKVKDKPTGEQVHKARMVAKGYSQVEGVDFDETFSPVIKYQSLRTLMAIANEEDMHVHHMDVTTAFLYGELEEDVYMHQAEGQVKPGEEHLVCKLQKSIYGLKQSPRCWNKKVHACLTANGFTATKSDPALYIKGKGNEKTILGLYVDDIPIASKSLAALESAKLVLMTAFKMTDFGEVSTILGIQITRDREKGILTMSQGKYAAEVLKRFNMTDAKGRDTPTESGVKLSVQMSPQTEEGRTAMEQIPYRQAVGSLMYLMVSTRPDLAAAVGRVSRFGKNPGPEHWRAVKWILMYLQKTKSHGLTFRKQGKMQVIGHCDSDHNGCVDTRRSTTGYVMKLGGGSISWCSRRQKTVALSSCEAEYMAACEATREATWEAKLLKELGYNGVCPIEIRSDSQSAIALIDNPVFHDKTKHIAAKYHFVREKVEDGTVAFSYCPTDSNIADSLTKGVPKLKTIFCRVGMGVEDQPAQG